MTNSALFSSVGGVDATIKQENQRKCSLEIQNLEENIALSNRQIHGTFSSLLARYCVTNKEMLEKLIEIADKDIRSTLDIDTPEWDAYYGITQQLVVI